MFCELAVLFIVPEATKGEEINVLQTCCLVYFMFLK